MSDRVVIVRSTRASRIGSVLGLVGLVLLILAPFLFLNSVLRTLVQFFALLAMAQWWNLLAGYAGLISIGQQAYIGIGGYALLALTTYAHINLFVAVPIAALIAGLISIPTAALVFRLRGGYFAIGTWVVAEVFRQILANVSQLGGGSGATITAAIGVDRTLRDYMTYWIALTVGVGSVVVIYALIRSRLGFALRSIRDRETAAGTLGVDVFRTKLVVYVIASTGCGLVGALTYLSLLRLQPSAAFSVNWTVAMIFIVVIGGIGTVTGPIVGTLVFFTLQQTFASQGSVYLIALGAVAIGVMLIAPRGLWGLVADRWDVRLFPVLLRVEELNATTANGENVD